MPPDCDASILPIVQYKDSRADLLGTGLVISSSVILTCAHIFQNLLVRNGTVNVPESVVALSGTTMLRPLRIAVEKALDLCCMHFEVVTGGVPVQLARSTRLRSAQVIAVGYISDAGGPRRNASLKLSVIHELQSTSGWLQFGQVRGGLPRAFSGGPVMARTKTGWEAVGVLQLGGEASATSRFIAVDPIASFLASERVRVPIGHLRPELPRSVRAVVPRSDVEAKNSVVIHSSNVGGSVTNRIVTPGYREVTEETWRNLERFTKNRSQARPAAKVNQLRELVEKHRYDAARPLWRSMRKNLLGIAEARPIVALFEALLSKDWIE